MAAKILVIALLVACAAADAYYGYGGYGYGGYRGGYGGYGYGGYRDGAPAYHPGGGVSYTARGPQGLGKRSADAEPEADADADADADAEASYGYGGYGYGGYGYGGYGGYGYGGYGKGYGYGYGRSYGKREAEPSGYSYQRVNRDFGYVGRSSYGVKTNGYNAYVDEARAPLFGSPYGYGKRYGKREAEPSGYSYQRVNRNFGYAGVSSYGVKTNGYNAYVDEARAPLFGSPYGYGKRYGKREAEPSGYSYQNVNRNFGYAGTSSYGVKTSGYAGYVNEARAQPYASYGYGFNAAGPYYG